MVERYGFKPGQRSRTIFVICNYIFMIITILVMMVPLLKVLSDSLDAVSSFGVNLWPREFTLEAYKVILTNSALYRPFLVSLYTTIVGTALALLLTTMAAYVLTQREMPGRTFFVYMILFTMIFSGGLIPTFMLIKNLGMLNSLWAVILPLSLQVYNVILMKNFFDGIPDSVSESAEIDGCSPFGIFWRIILPMSKPALAAIGLFCVVHYWNDFFHFVIYINDPKWYNFQVKLRAMVLTDDMATHDTKIFGKSLQNAAIVVSMIPVMILYPFLQKHFVKGINLGAVKG